MKASHTQFQKHGFDYGIFHAQTSALTVDAAKRLGVSIGHSSGGSSIEGGDKVQLHQLITQFETVKPAKIKALDAQSCQDFYKQYGETNAVNRISLAKNVVTHQKSEEQFLNDIKRLSNIPVIVKSKQQASHVVTTQIDSDKHENMSDWLKGQFSNQDAFYHQAVQSLPFVFSQGIMSNAGYFEGLASRPEAADLLIGMGKMENADDYVLIKPKEGEKQIDVVFVSVAYGANGAVSDVCRRVMTIQSDAAGDHFTYGQVTDVIAAPGIAEAMQSSVQIGKETNDPSIMKSVLADLNLIEQDYKANSGNVLNDKDRSDRISKAKALCQSSFQSIDQLEASDNQQASYWHMKSSYRTLMNSFSTPKVSKTVLVNAYQSLLYALKTMETVDPKAANQIRALVSLKLQARISGIETNQQMANSFVHNLAVLSKGIRPEVSEDNQEKAISLNYFFSAPDSLKWALENNGQNVAQKDIQAILALKNPAQQSRKAPKTSALKQFSWSMLKKLKPNRLIPSNRIKKINGDTYTKLNNEGVVAFALNPIVEDYDDIDRQSLGQESIHLDQAQPCESSDQLMSDWAFFDHTRLIISELKNMSGSEGINEDLADKINSCLENIETVDVDGERAQQIREVLYAAIYHQYDIESDDGVDLVRYLEALAGLDKNQRLLSEMLHDDNTLMGILEAHGSMRLNNSGKDAAKSQLRTFLASFPELDLEDNQASKHFTP